MRALLTDLLRDDRIHPALQRVLIEQVLRTSARREMLGFEERLEAKLAEALRAANLDHGNRSLELMTFVLVRVVLSVVQGAVADRPRLNGPALIDELTYLVTRYVDTAD